MGQGKRYKTTILKEHKKIIVFTIALISIILFSIIMQTLSKYVLKRKDIAEVHASKFYFESNIQENNSYTWNGKDEYIIEINLKNYEDILRFTTDNISYEINTSTEANVNIITEINGVQASEGVIQGKKSEKNEDKITLILNTNGEKIVNDFTIKLTITSKSPYTKVINGNINIKIAENNDYEINLKSESDYESLLIKTNNYKGDLKIKFDEAKLMPYETDKITNEGELTVNTEAGSNYQIDFIKLVSGEKIEIGEDIIIEN